MKYEIQLSEAVTIEVRSGAENQFLVSCFEDDKHDNMIFRVGRMEFMKHGDTLYMKDLCHPAAPRGIARMLAKIFVDKAIKGFKYTSNDAFQNDRFDIMMRTNTRLLIGYGEYVVVLGLHKNINAPEFIGVGKINLYDGDVTMFDNDDCHMWEELADDEPEFEFYSKPDEDIYGIGTPDGTIYLRWNVNNVIKSRLALK
jgi:hypothetical protein